LSFQAYLKQHFLQKDNILPRKKKLYQRNAQKNDLKNMTNKHFSFYICKVIFYCGFDHIYLFSTSRKARRCPWNFRNNRIKNLKLFLEKIFEKEFE